MTRHDPQDPRHSTLSVMRRARAQVLRRHHGAIVQTPLTFQNCRQIKLYPRSAGPYEYGRYGTPTQTPRAEAGTAGGAEECLLFDSGMSAVTTTLLGSSARAITS